MEDKRYRIISSTELVNIDYSDLWDNDITTTRYSVDGELAIIEYKNIPNTKFILYTADEIIEYIEANYADWNP